MRFEAFKTIMLNGYTGQELRMRNNEKIRILFAEIITVLAQSRKSNSFDAIKIDKEYFDITQLTQTLKADSAQYAQLIFRPKDPQNVYKEKIKVCGREKECDPCRTKISNGGYMDGLGTFVNNR